jgi:hypothetical protein
MAMSGGGTPAPPPIPEAPPPAPTKADPAVIKAKDDERDRQRAAAGAASTIKTSGQGVLDPASTTKSALLGG